MVSGNEKLAGYELKVSNITQADLSKSLDQAKRYADHFNLKVHLVNFCSENDSFPVNPQHPPKNVVLVNVRYSPDYSNFTIYTPDGDATQVQVIRQS